MKLLNWNFFSIYFVYPHLEVSFSSFHKRKRFKVAYSNLVAALNLQIEVMVLGKVDSIPIVMNGVPDPFFVDGLGFAHPLLLEIVTTYFLNTS